METAADGGVDTGRECLVEQAATALKDGLYPRAIRLAKHALAADERNQLAYRILVEATAAVGRVDVARELLKIHHAGQAKRFVRYHRAAVRGASRRGFDEAWVLMQQLHAVHPIAAALARDLIRPARSTADLQSLKIFIDQAFDLHVRSELLAIVELECNNFDEAYAHFRCLPQGTPTWKTLGLGLMRLARQRRDYAAVSSLSDVLLEMEGEHRFAVMRQAAFAYGHTDQIEKARAAFTDVLRWIQQVYSDDAVFTAKWKQIAKFSFKVFDVRNGFAYLQKAVDMGLCSDRQGFGSEIASSFLERFEPELDASWRSFLTFLDTGIFPPGDELVRVVVPGLKAFVDDPLRVPAQTTWLNIVQETARQCRACGKTALFVLECFGRVAEEQRPATLSLSYHTHSDASAAMHFKEADLPHYATIDRRGYAGWSTLARRDLEDLRLDSIDPSAAEMFFKQFKTKVTAGSISKYPQPGTGVGTQPTMPYVFIALQIPTDNVQELARINMFDMLRMIVRRFKSTQYTVVMKRHPLDGDRRVDTLLTELVDNQRVVASDANIHDLIAGCAAVLTTNSGVGSEALIHLKPVYLFGEADYSAVCHNIIDEEDLAVKTSPITLPVSEDVIKRFVHFYRRRYMVNTASPSDLSRKVRNRVIRPALGRCIDPDQV